MNLKTVLVVALTLAILFEAQAGKLVKKKRRRLVKKTGKAAEKKEAEAEPETGEKARDARYLQTGMSMGLYGGNRLLERDYRLPSTIQQQIRAQIPYDVNAHDLIAMESLMNTQSVSLPTGSVEESLAGYAGVPSAALSGASLDATEGYPQEAFYGFGYQDLNEDKQFDTIREGVENVFGGNQENEQSFHFEQNGQQFGPQEVSQEEDNSLIRAALPVAIAGFMALAISSFFANQVTVNATSNDDMALLFELPIDIDNRKKRSADDFLTDEYNEVDLDADDSSFYGQAMSVLSEYARRIKNGVMLFSMMETDEECRKKIACIFGTETRRSASRDIIAKVVGHVMPKKYSGFNDYFEKARRSEVEQDCSLLECNKCFTL